MPFLVPQRTILGGNQVDKVKLVRNAGGKFYLDARKTDGNRAVQDYLWKDLLGSGDFTKDVTNIIGADGNFGVDNDGDGLANNWITNAVGTKSMSNNIQTFKTNSGTVGNIRTQPATPNAIDDVVYACAYVNAQYGGANNANVSLRIKEGTTTKATTNHSTSNGFEFLSARFVTTATTANPAIQDGNASGFTDIQVKQVIFLNLTAIFGAGFEPSKGYIDYYIQNYLTTIGYLSTATINLRDALRQNMAGSSSSGLNIDNPNKPYWAFDGTDDRFEVQNIDNINIVNPPLSAFFTVKTSDSFGNGYVFCRNLDAANNIHFAFVINVDGSGGVNMEGTSRCTVGAGTFSTNTVYNIGFIWTGTNIYIYRNFIEIASSSFANSGAPLTSRPRFQLGCRASTSAGYAAHQKLNLATLTIYSGDNCTKENVLKAERAISKAYLA